MNRKITETNSDDSVANTPKRSVYLNFEPQFSPYSNMKDSLPCAWHSKENSDNLENIRKKKNQSK
jgi:hypothetical protein